MARQYLVSQQAQLLLACYLRQIVAVEQRVRRHIAWPLCLESSLLPHAVIEVVGRKHHRPHHIAVGLAHCKEVHAVLAYVLHTPTELCSGYRRLVSLTRRHELVFATGSINHLERHIDLARAHEEHGLVAPDGLHFPQRGTVEEFVALAYRLCLHCAEGPQAQHHYRQNSSLHITDIKISQVPYFANVHKSFQQPLPVNSD